MSGPQHALSLMCPVASCSWGKGGNRYVGSSSLALAGHVQKRHPEELRPLPLAPRAPPTAMPAPKRAAIYLRVSTVDQHPENQLPNIRQHCALKGWEIVEVYEDRASGKNMDRPALQRLLHDSVTGHPPPFDVVVFRRLSRLGRSLKDNITLFDHFAQLGIAMVSTEESYDTSTVTGRFQRNILASVHEYFRENMIEEIKEGQARRRAEGKYMGRHPAGCGIPTELGGLGPCPDGKVHRGFDPTTVGQLAAQRRAAAERQRRSRAKRDKVGSRRGGPSPGDRPPGQEA